MAELGGTVEYLYWSSRRTSRFVEDNNVTVQQVTRTITSPALKLLPTFSRSTTSTGNLRPQIAKAIEGALGQQIVTRFNAPGPIRYAKGSSTVVFGEFVTWLVKPERQPALMFTVGDYDRKDRGSVAICLFGSMDNFPEYVQSVGPGFSDEGWVSSSAPAIYNFLSSHGRQIDDPLDREALARDALKTADGQGLCRDFNSESTTYGIDEPWQRAFTYGDASKAEWLAQIYLDVDLLMTDNGREDGFRRVLVGAPLWIRTPSPRAIRLYATSDDLSVVEGRRFRARQEAIADEIVADRSLSNREGDDLRSTATLGGADEQTEEPVEPTITMPYSVYGPLKGGFITRWADWAAQQVKGNAEDRIEHVGDLFGRVFAWVWSRDRDQAMIVLADYLARLREGHPEIEPPIRLDEILEGLRLALPFGFDDYSEVVTMARREVRKYYGADPNA